MKFLVIRIFATQILGVRRSLTGWADIPYWSPGPIGEDQDKNASLCDGIFSAYEICISVVVYQEIFASVIKDAFG